MAQPPAYNRVKDFGADYPDQTDNQAINTELDAVSSSVNGIRANLALIQRDDGGLRDGIVTKDSLAQSFKDELYAEFSGNINDSVLEAQQAAVEATNAAAAANADAAAAQSARDTAQSAAGTAQASAASASASQGAAASSAASASGSATTASAAAASASGSATSASTSAASAQDAREDAVAAASAAVPAATTATAKAAEASVSAASASADATLAQNWASKLDGPVTGALYSARYYANLAQAGAGLPLYQPIAVPTTDVGDISVAGLGIHRFKYGRYAPDNFPPRHRVGGVLTSTATSVTVAAGSWRGAANDLDIILGASLSKNLQTSGAWAAGSGSNGIVGGVAAASTWYHVHLIRQDSTGAIDVCLDTSPTASNRPAGWSAYRRVGAVFNQSSGGVRPFVQTGLVFRYLSPVNNLNNSALPDTSLTVATVATPLGVSTMAYLALALAAQSAAAFGFVFTPGDTDRAVLAYANVAASSAMAGVGNLQVMTDTSSRVNSRGAGSIPSGFYLSTISYTDFIGD
ncbi:hypothetical protein LMG7053_04810 [Achromobacter ruhlandii]|uniref:Phage tail protein n=1 Tax=Achromobacter ruhlandii TaxID=72557 RepID=A0ABM8M2K9_9BURK|nr:hypothetical protein [Achromobacter ruhlandii]CAB3955804.1 hypothetical protein LMG7053_04810 [Achromobacter ruhlandii]